MVKCEGIRVYTANDLDQASQKEVKLLVSLWGLLESLVQSEVRRGIYAPLKPKDKEEAEPPNHSLEALSQHPYVTTKLLSLQPLIEMEEMEEEELWWSWICLDHADFKNHSWCMSSVKWFFAWHCG